MQASTINSINISNLDLSSPIKYHYLPAFKQDLFSSYVGVARLNGTIDLIKAANLLPINLANEPGSLQAIKFDDVKRGIIRRDGTMKNMIIADMCVIDNIEGEKIINIKICPSAIQISGLKSDDIVQQVCYFIQNHLYQLQTTLLNYSIEQHYLVMQWLLYQTYGQVMQIQDGSYIITINNVDLNLVTSDIPIELVQIYLRPLESTLMHDWQKYYQLLNRFLLRLNVYDGDLGLAKIDRTNFLYNYALGCQVDRRRLADLLDNYNGFTAKYNNLVRGSVHVILLCDQWQSPFARKFGKDEPKHHFSISSNGKVTQNSPCIELADKVYYRLIQALIELNICPYNNIV